MVEYEMRNIGFMISITFCTSKVHRMVKRDYFSKWKFFMRARTYEREKMNKYHITNDVILYINIYIRAYTCIHKSMCIHNWYFYTLKIWGKEHLRKIWYVLRITKFRLTKLFLHIKNDKMHIHFIFWFNIQKSGSAAETQTLISARSLKFWRQKIASEYKFYNFLYSI